MGQQQIAAFLSPLKQLSVWRPSLYKQHPIGHWYKAQVLCNSAPEKDWVEN
jgi:hypothetical protein